MRIGIFLVAAFFVSMVLPCVTAQAGIDETLSAIAKETALKTLKDKDFEFENGGFKGNLSAVKPEEELEIEVKDFSLADDSIKAKVKVKGLFLLDGEYETGGVSTMLEATMFVTIEPKFKTQLIERDGQFFVKSEVEDLSFKVKVNELKPASISGSKGTITTLLNAAYAAKKKEILKQVNKNLPEKKLEF